MAVQMQELDRKRETLEEEEYSPWCLSTWPPCWSERMRPSCRLSTIRSQPNPHTHASAPTHPHTHTYYLGLFPPKFRLKVQVARDSGQSNIADFGMSMDSVIRLSGWC